MTLASRNITHHRYIIPAHLSWTWNQIVQILLASEGCKREEVLYLKGCGTTEKDYEFHRTTKCISSKSRTSLEASKRLAKLTRWRKFSGAEGRKSGLRQNLHLALNIGRRWCAERARDRCFNKSCHSEKETCLREVFGKAPDNPNSLNTQFLTSPCHPPDH